MRMKQIKNTLLLASLLLAGCTAEETPEVDNGITPVPPVELTTPLEIESASLEAEVTTRATTTLGSGNSIGVFLSGTGYTDRNNCYYAYYSSSSWLPYDGSHTIYLGGASASVCAYHPWTSGNNNKTAIPLTSQIYSGDKDISFATNRTLAGNSTNKSTSFAMTRAYGMLNIKLIKSSDYPGTCSVTKLEFQNLLKTANLNIATGVYSAGRGISGTTFSETKTVTPTTSGTSWGDFLLVPCIPYNDSMKIVLTVDGKTMTTTIASASYHPGKGEYKQITLTIKGTSLGVTSVTTTDWPAASDGGSYVPTPSY